MRLTLHPRRASNAEPQRPARVCTLTLLVLLLALLGDSSPALAVKPPRNSAPSQKNSAPEPQELQRKAVETFDRGEFEEALRLFESLVPRTKSGALEENLYHLALCHFSLGHFEKALEAFESLLQQFPKSRFLAETEYRIAASRFPLNEFERVVGLCAAWESQHLDHALLGEVLALKGDALNALEKREEAAIAYRTAVEKGTQPDILQYALVEACKLQQRFGQWQTCIEMIVGFLKTHPDHPAEIAAAEWLAKARAKLSLMDEAKKDLVQTLLKHLSDRSQERVEEGLQQLAALLLQSTDPRAELLASLDSKSSPPGLPRARTAFAEAELLRLQKQKDESERLLDELTSAFDPTVLSAPLLALLGDRLLAKQNLQGAASFYTELTRSFPKSLHHAAAFHGFGQIALHQNKPDDALRWFSIGLEHFGSSPTAKDLALGKGRALLALTRFDEAQSAFEQVAANRAWRGEATAEAVFLIGETLFQKGDYAAAVQYFQRVFVAYQHHVPIVAKSYLRAADCFEQMGSPEKAAAHLREIRRKSKFNKTPEAEIARERLEQLKKP